MKDGFVKKFLTIAGVVIVLLVVALSLSLNTIVENSIEKYGSLFLDTRVEVGSSTLSVFSGRGELEDFSIANPEGYPDKKAVGVEHLELNVDLTTLFSNPVVIERIAITRPALRYDTGPQGNNFDALLKNLRKDSGGTGSGTGRKVVVDELVIRDGTVTLSVGGGELNTFALPPIRKTNLGQGDNGLSFAQTSAIVLAAVRDAVLATVSGAGTLIKEGAEGVMDTVKGIFE